MKVYIITKEPFPYGMAATNRIICYAKALQHENIPCEVIIFTRTEVYGKKSNNTINKGNYEGISFRYISNTTFRSKNVIIRKIFDIFDRFKLRQYLKKELQQDDVVIGYAGSLVNYINKIIDLVHAKKAIYIRELCEFPYGTSKETKRNIRLRKIVLQKQFPKCDGFIAISETLKELAYKYKSSQAVVTKIPILVDFAKYNLPNYSYKASVPYIFHSGTLYEQKDGILGMIEAFVIAEQKITFPIYFISTGDKENSTHKKEIDILIDKYHLKGQLLFIGYITNDELREYLSKATLVIINKKNTQQNKYCFSTKLAEYLAAGKPTIITNIGEAINWLQDRESAIIIDSQNTLLMADKIIELFLNPALREHLSITARQTCKTYFDYIHYGAIIKSLIQEIKTNKNEHK